MGYLDNSSITVDAVLTKKGREILKNGGNLNISSFTLSDTGIDYTLWNPDHPSGSAFYGEALENLPGLESTVHAEYNLRNRLITMDQSNVAIPAIVLGNLDTTGGHVKTFNEGDQNTQSGIITVDLLGQDSVGGNGNANTTHPYYFVIQDPSIVETNAELMSGLSGTSMTFLPEQDIPSAQQYGFSGTEFELIPRGQDSAGKQTNVYVVHVATGAYNSFRVVNNIVNPETTLLPTGGIGA